MQHILELEDVVLLNLEESKALASLRQRMTTRDIMLATSMQVNKKLKRLRQSRQSQYSIEVRDIQRQIKRSMADLYERFKKGKLTKRQLRDRAYANVRNAYKTIFESGLKVGLDDKVAAGIEKAKNIKASPEEQRWFKTAVNQEMRYLKGFVEDIQQGKLRMPFDRRLDMYIDSLRSFYNTVRVMTAPALTLIHWVTRGDKKVCASCREIVRYSPFTKENLPFAPGAGYTLCLTNCRCKLVIRNVTQDKYLDVQRRSLTKEVILKRMQRILRDHGR